MRPEVYENEAQPFDPMQHPDNVALDVTPPVATPEGEPIPEVLLVEDDLELAAVDINAIAHGADDVGTPLPRAGGF